MKSSKVFLGHTSVRLDQTDASGNIFFNQIFQVFHAAYEEMLTAHGLSIAEIIRQKEILLPIVHAEADYLHPIKIGDKLVIKLYVGRIGQTSFSLHYQISSESAKTMATGKTVHVCVSAKTAKKINLPPIVKNLFQRL